MVKIHVVANDVITKAMLIDMTEKGYTLNEMLESSRVIAGEIKKGNFPIEGTTEKDYMMIGEFVVYTPYIPLYTTPLITDKKD